MSSKHATRPHAPAPRTDLLSLLFHIALPIGAIAGAATTPLRQPTLILAVVYYLFCGFCYTAGYHRLFAHRSYTPSWLLKVVLALFGAGNFLGPLTTWVRDHRAHHRHTDSDRDPFNRNRGFWYAYLGSRLCDLKDIGDADISDLVKDSVVNTQVALYPVFAAGLGLCLPTAVANLWGDAMGGLVYAGLWRVLIFLHVQYLVWALGHTYGHQPYSDSHSGRNHGLLSILTLGEAYLNFHAEFPSDYRMGPFYYHFDATKWVLRALSFCGLASNFNKTPYKQVLRVRVQQQEAELDRVRATIDFGPKLESLPKWTKAEFDQQVAAGRPLIIRDSIAHDLTGFFDKHPGGPEVLQPKIGKDATIAFNGGVQRHSKAARNLAAFMRVAVVENASDLRKDVQAKKLHSKQAHDE